MPGIWRQRGRNPCKICPYWTPHRWAERELSRKSLGRVLKVQIQACGKPRMRRRDCERMRPLLLPSFVGQLLFLFGDRSWPGASSSRALGTNGDIDPHCPGRDGASAAQNARACVDKLSTLSLCFFLASGFADVPANVISARLQYSYEPERRRQKEKRPSAQDKRHYSCPYTKGTRAGPNGSAGTACKAQSAAYRYLQDGAASPGDHRAQESEPEID